MEANDALFRVKSEARLQAARLRLSSKGDIQILLAEADSIKRDLAHMGAACLDLQRQVQGLQESRRDMLAQMRGMVPRSDLQAAQAEAAALRGSVDGLQREAAAGLQEREQLMLKYQVRYQRCQYRRRAARRRAAPARFVCKRYFVYTA